MTSEESEDKDNVQGSSHDYISGSRSEAAELNSTPDLKLLALDHHSPVKQSVSMSRETPSSSMSVRKSSTANTSKHFKRLESSDDVNDEARTLGLSHETDPKQLPEEAVFDGSLERSVFAIDHIREFIFHLLDKPTLFKSRLVCSRWTNFASKELQKTVTLKLYEVNRNPAGSAGLPSVPKCNFVGVAPNGWVVNKDNTGRSIGHLAALLQNSTKSEFPCTSIVYHVRPSNWKITQSFFDTYGPYLKKLHIVGPSPDRPILFEDFQQILSTQAPNIEHLIFEGKVIVQQPCPRPSRLLGNFISWHNYHLETDFGSTRYDAQISKGFTHLNLSRLRVLEIRGGIFETILRSILDASPNLFEVKMTCNEFLHCLVKPGSGTGPNNRRHLIKQLKLTLTETSLSSLDTFANTYGISENPLAIRRLCLHAALELKQKQHLIPRCTAALCKILKNSSVSLQELIWGQMEFLTGLQFPRMVNVKKIRLVYMHEDDIDSVDLNGQHHHYHPIPIKFFPQMDFNLGTTFPGLKYVEFIAPHLRAHYGDDDFHGTDIRMSELFQNVEPVVSVTSVSLYHLKETESLRELFPNATFTGKFKRAPPVIAQ